MNGKLKKNLFKNFQLIIIFIIASIQNTFAIKKEIDGIAAIVDHNIVLKSDLNNLIKNIQQHQKNEKINISNKIIYDVALNNLIKEKIIFNIGEKIDLIITKEKIDEIIKHIAFKNNLTLQEMKNKLELNNVDLNYYQNQIKKEIIMKEIRNNQICYKIPILQKDIDFLYKKIELNNKNPILKIDHILIPLSKNANKKEIEKIGKKISLLVNKIKNGKDFNSLKKEYSTCKNTFCNNLDGYVEYKKIPKIFFEDIHNTQIGNIIGPIRSDFGFHFFKINNINQDNKILISQIKIRHIFIQENPILDIKNAYKKIKTIHDKIKNNILKFEEAAKKYSDDFHSSLQGGFLDWNNLENYDQTFQKKIKKLKENEISEPFHSKLGWHIIQLLKIKKIYSTKNDAQKEKIYQLLYLNKCKQEENIWIEQQYANSYIKLLHN
ncbi:MAG: peptidylprolyl isomerase [Arsenophonus sp.]|nr:MAG: peptidylprolyl isomerase [Arsenophonus sp.]